MPFAYYGAKHGLASKYPRPAHGLVIEPFAGAAGYSVCHASLGLDHLLNDLEPSVVSLWRRLQAMTGDELAAVLEGLDDDRTDDILIASCAGSTAWAPIAAGASRQVTPRMRSDAPGVIRRIANVLDSLKSWDIQCGDYRDLPDVEATWFVDPPYQPLGTMAGQGYVKSSAGICYEELGDWCRSRKGQVIVCEQSPASWLPFTHLAHQQNGSANGQSRSEVVWLSQQQQQVLF